MRIVQGTYIPLEEMTQTEDISNFPNDKAELWYTQAYSLVDYLLNSRTRDEFYKLSTEIKAKTPLHQALYRAFGMPFNKVSVLENVWLHDLQKAYQAGKLVSPKPEPQKPAVKKPEPAKQPQTAPKPAPKPQPKKAPQQTKINKLQMVPVMKY